MRLFGRKANQQPTTPPPSVPPELSQYYGTVMPVEQPIRRTDFLLRLGMLVAGLVLVGLLIGGSVWWRGHHPASKNTVATNNHSAPASSTSNSKSDSPSQPSQPGQPATADQPQQPATGQANTQPTTTTPYGNSATATNNQSVVSAATIPSTGPADVGVYALIASIFGTVLAYIWQLKRQQ